MYHSIAYNVPSSKLTQVMTTGYKITLYGRRHIAILATTSPKTAAKMLQPSHPANLRWILASSIRNWSLRHMKISIHAYLAATLSYNAFIAIHIRSRAQFKDFGAKPPPGNKCAYLYDLLLFLHIFTGSVGIHASFHGRVQAHAKITLIFWEGAINVRRFARWWLYAHWRWIKLESIRMLYQTQTRNKVVNYLRIWCVVPIDA